MDSFPASDPPAWSSGRAAASTDTACPPEMIADARRSRMYKRLAIGAGALGVVAVGLLVFRHLRAR